MSATFIVYRAAYCCAVLGCGEVLNRFGQCLRHGRLCEPLWTEDAEEIELDLFGHHDRPDRSVGYEGGYVCEGAEFEGAEFPMTKDEQERADELYAEAEEGVARGRYEDAMEAKAEARREAREGR